MMQYLRHFVVALTALILRAGAVAIPTTQLAVNNEDCNESSVTSQHTQLKLSQSQLFGWQLSGSAIDDNDQTCAKMKSGDYQVWASAGLVLDQIQGPLCSGTNATSALPDAILSSTAMLTTLFASSFHPSSADATNTYLCNNLRTAQLNAFPLNDQQIINATCTRAGLRPAPVPFTPISTANMTAVAAYRNATSALYAAQYASGLSCEPELAAACTQAQDPAQRAAWKALALVPDVVEAQLCSFAQPPTAPQAKAAIAELTSRAFAAVLLGSSDVDGYPAWLCENLDETAMDGVGLDGRWVKGAVCGS